MSRNDLHQALKGHNVIARKYFYPLCSTFECYKGLPSSAAENLPVATRIASQCMALPFYGGLTDADVSNIVDLIKNMPR